MVREEAMTLTLYRQLYEAIAEAALYRRVAEWMGEA